MVLRPCGGVLSDVRKRARPYFFATGGGAAFCFYLLFGAYLFFALRPRRPSLSAARKGRKTAEGGVPLREPPWAYLLFWQGWPLSLPRNKLREKRREAISIARSACFAAQRSPPQMPEVRGQISEFLAKADAHFWLCALFRRNTDPAHGILWQSNIFVPLPIPKSNADNLQKSHCW